MVRHLLLAAAIVAAAAAAGEYSLVLGGACGCGSGVQTYSTATTAYCPAGYPRCDIASMVESACTISCGSNARASIAYRNNSAVWLYTDKISCSGGALTNGAGATLFNVQRPTCALKARCDECATIAHQPKCPMGMTCNPDRLVKSTATDGCSRLACTEGTLKLYDGTGAPLENNAPQLYCTTAKTWSNYSLDGATGGGVAIGEPFTTSCVLPNSCSQCPNPLVATSFLQLEARFRTGFALSQATHAKEAGTCSSVTCPAGYTLYGFAHTSSETGLEHTSRGSLKCDSSGKWANGGVENTPKNLLMACLQNQACGAYDELSIDTRNVICDNGQSKVDCAGKQIQVYTSTTSVAVSKMVFVKSKGWLSFSCDGRARLWSATEITSVHCIDPTTTQAPTTTTQPPATNGCPVPGTISQADLDAQWAPGTETFSPATITDGYAQCGAGQSLFVQIVGTTDIFLPYTVSCKAGKTEWTIFGPGWNTEDHAHVNVICINKKLVG